MNDDVELHFLARWWHNGKPLPARDDRGRAISRGRLVSFAQELTVGFGLPDTMQEAKAGDKVAVQVCCCPGGWEGISSVGIGLEGSAGLYDEDRVNYPVLSNRFEFRLTAEQIALARRLWRALAPGPAGAGK